MKLAPILTPQPELVTETRLDLVLEIDDTENTLSTQLPTFLKQAQQSSFFKLEIAIPLDWSSLPLSQHGFAPILHSFTLPLSANSLSPPYPNSRVNFSDLKYLLIQQADYHHQLYPQYFRSSLDINWQDYQKYYFASPPNPSLIYFHHPHGFIIGAYENSFAHIWDLIVDENHRGIGIGQQLLTQFIATATNLKLEKLIVETGYNQPAQKLYLKNGFTPTLQTWYFQMI